MHGNRPIHPPTENPPPPNVLKISKSAPVIYRKESIIAPTAFHTKSYRHEVTTNHFATPQEAQFRFTTNTRLNHSSETIGLSFNQVISLVRRRKFAFIMLLLTALALLFVVPGLLGADKTKGPKVTDKVSIKHV